MGVFFVDLEVAGLSGADAGVRIAKVLVDTGSELTWLPEAELKRAGLQVAKKNQAFVMANGQQITRDIGFGRLSCAGFITVDEIVFAHDGDLALLGARTLEGFNAGVDPVGRRLVASGPIPAAAAEQSFGAFRPDQRGARG